MRICLGPALAVGLSLATAAPCARRAEASNCAATSIGFVPLTDMGPGTYHGLPGGLYPGGTNFRPVAHESAGVAIARAIVPLDTLGNPDPVNGRIVLISIGMSNCTQEFSAFVPKATSFAGRHPRLLVIDCAEGGQATQDIRLPTAAYWGTVAQRLRAQGSSPLQAQVAWIKEARRGPTEPFPASAESLTNDLGAIVRIARDKLPNLRIAYLTSRIYAGYATSTLNPEPYAYESGFAVRWLIGAQIAGVDSLHFDAASGPVESPWLSWGPYLWADGLVPRRDGLVWHCTDFQSDGTHPSTSGRELVADSLLAFLKRDVTSEPWFLNPALVSVGNRVPAAAPRLSIAPNPAGLEAAITFAAAPGATWRLGVFDLAGRRVRDLGAGAGAGAAKLRWDGRDQGGARVRAGVYQVRLESGGQTRSACVVMLRGR
jgi:hypothetical protein